VTGVQTCALPIYRELLFQAFDNIIENAERHAFSDNRKNEIIVFANFDFTKMVIEVSFSNNGIPVPKDFTFEKFARKGNKTSSNGGKGIGGWIIHEVIKKHNGNLSISYSTEGRIKFKTRIILEFPIEIKI